MPADRHGRTYHLNNPAVQHERARRPGSQPPPRIGFYNRTGFARNLHYQSVGVGYVANNPPNYFDNPPFQIRSPSPPAQPLDLAAIFPNWQRNSPQNIYSQNHTNHQAYQNVPLQNPNQPFPFHFFPPFNPVNPMHALHMQAMQYGIANVQPGYVQPRYFHPPTLQHDGAGPSNASSNQIAAVEATRNERSPDIRSREPVPDNSPEAGRQQANIEELYNALRFEFLDRQIRESALLHLENRNDFGELGHYLEDTVSWVRTASFNENIPYSEQKNLLLNNWRELMVITIAERNHRFRAEALVSRLSADRPNIEDEVTRMMTTINRLLLLNMDPIEFDCLKKIMIFRTEIPFLCSSASRDDLQERGLFQLYKYNARDYPFRVGKTLLLLPSVCFVSQMGLIECLLFKIPCDLNTLLLTWLSREQQ